MMDMDCLSERNSFLGMSYTMLITEDSIVTVKCRTTIKVLFFLMLVYHVHLHKYLFILLHTCFAI